MNILHQILGRSDRKLCLESRQGCRNAICGSLATWSGNHARQHTQDEVYLTLGYETIGVIVSQEKEERNIRDCIFLCEC